MKIIFTDADGNVIEKTLDEINSPNDIKKAIDELENK